MGFTGGVAELGGSADDFGADTEEFADESDAGGTEAVEYTAADFE